MSTVKKQSKAKKPRQQKQKLTVLTGEQLDIKRRVAKTKTRVETVPAEAPATPQPLTPALRAKFGLITTKLRYTPGSNLHLRLLTWAYPLSALLVLAATTVFWSVLGARAQGSNADQIVDPYLFSNGPTFHGADFPGSHTFLIKWPLFWLVKVLGISSTSLVAVTVGTVLVTVAILAFVLYRLERRPLVFGTLILALASCLLLVPAQPAPGTLLPVNMAMLATRNLEYVIYILGLILLIRARRTRNWYFWLAVLVLGLLIASDKLFLYMSLGGAGLALLTYALRRNWRVVEAASRWLLASIAAAIVAIAVLALLQRMGVTHIVNGSGGTPYQPAHGAKNLLIGTVYAVLGFLANLGANPASAANELAQIPHQALKQLLTASGPAYIINLAIVLGGLLAVWQLLKASLFARRDQPETFTHSHMLSLTLIWTSLAAVGLFIVSDHYYPVDARYLTICLFALFVAVAAYTRQRVVWHSKYWLLIGAVITIGMLLAIPGTLQSYHANQRALADVDHRNQLVTQALSHHRVDVLVGDYWRVLPTKLITAGQQNVLPLGSCVAPRNTLTSQAWQPDLRHHSFAYLLSYDHGLTDYPDCSLKQVVAAYGRPNASILIAGNFAHPHEVLLFYDHGSHQFVPPSTRLAPQPLASVVPINIADLMNTSCDGPTIMNIVAHQDDDLLFMNPDLLHDIRDGHCVRTVYVTAGDAGADQFYWLSRQQGSEAAYTTMLNAGDRWTQRIVKLSDTSYVTIVNPTGNHKVSLLFLNLPDGGLYGEGFGANHHESLSKLEAGRIKQIQTVDHESTYTTDQLVSTLETLMHTYQPAEIRTQAPDNMSAQYPDHSDHLSAGRIARQAYNKYETDQYDNKVTIPISYYIGYPIHARAPNVSGTDLDQKEAAFFAYAKHDNSVCRSANDCANSSTYGAYLTHQYQENQ